MIKNLIVLLKLRITLLVIITSYLGYYLGYYIIRLLDNKDNILNFLKIY